MATDPRNGMEILDDDASWELLEGQVVGRMGVAVAGEVDIFPLNYLVHERTIVFKTAQGSKLAALAANARVTFEIDGYSPESGDAWSVVVKGVAQALQRLSEIYSAEDLPAVPLERLAQGVLRPDHSADRRGPSVLGGRRPTAPG